MPARLSLPARPLLYAGLLYLALPMILFLWGWLQPFFSLPLCATLAYGLHATVRKLPEWRFSLTKRGTVLLLLLSAGCLLLTFLCGFTGHFQQHADFTIRNAVYGQLIAEPWPLVMPDGHHFIYYLGHWLPPACAAAFCPAAYASWLLAGWTFLGLELALLTAACLWGIRKTAWWTLLLLCLGSPAASLDFLGMPLSHLFPEYNAQMALFIGIPSQIFNTFNHAVPALLCTVLLLTRSLPASGYYLMGALLLPGSPLAALILLPFILYETLFRDSACGFRTGERLRPLLLHPVFWVAFLCVGVMSLFYAHLDGGGQFSCLLSDQYAEAFHYTMRRMVLYPDSVKYASFLLSLLLNVLLPGALLFAACRRMPLYYITLGGMACCFFFRMGVMNNELLFKAPAVLYPSLAFLFLHAFRTGSTRSRIFLAVYVTFTAIPSMICVAEKLGTFSTDSALMQAHRQENYGGTLYHPEQPFHRQFIKKDGHPLPAWLFKRCRKP